MSASETLALLYERPTITVPEAAAILGVSRETAYRWAREGNLPAIRWGTNTVRIPSAALLALLQVPAPHTSPVDGGPQ
jgi:excisionase family DNA binding protein